MRLLASVLVAAVAGVTAAQPPCPCPDPPAPAPRDTVLRWNEAALRAVRADRTPPPVAARNLAVLHLAAHDAAAATVAADAPIRVRYVTPVAADPAAAAAVAAHRVLVALHPARVAEFDAALAEPPAAVPAGPARARGVALGQATAEAVLRWRAADGPAARRADYRPQPGPGRWRPTPDAFAPPLLPGWGRVSCFG